MKINRKHFFDSYRAGYGKLTQALVDNLNFLLTKLENGRFKLDTQMAYILATIKHETADTYLPVVEGYWMKNSRVQKLYNYYATHNRGALRTIFPNGVEGLTYEGRGFVQLTHNFNYEKFGLLHSPNDAMIPETAYTILEKGMANGSFTGKSLQQYVNENSTDYYSARKVINGLDRATLIAGYSRAFERAIELVPEENAMAGYVETDYIEMA